MSVQPSHQGYPHPISMESEGGSEGGPTAHLPDAHLSPQSSHMQTRQLLPSMNPRLSAAVTKNAELYKHQRLSNYKIQNILAAKQLITY